MRCFAVLHPPVLVKVNWVVLWLAHEFCFLLVSCYAQDHA